MTEKSGIGQGQAAQIFCSGASSFVREQSASVDKKFAAKLTPAKTDFSITSGISLETLYYKYRSMEMTTGNPFISAYLQSDWFGKGVFWGLFLLSALSWWVLIHKSWVFFHMRRLSNELLSQFSENDPLGLQFIRPMKGKLLEVPNPFFEVYKTMKQHVLQVINKNHFYIPTQETSLSDADMSLIESQVHASISSQTKKLDKHMFVLSTVVTLGPFLGLLGTVWGILVTFSQINQKGLAAASNASMLSGLSLALATTVFGLIVAIPALVGYNYLKNAGREFRRDLEEFSNLLLTAIELHYRRPEHAKTAPPAP